MKLLVFSLSIFAIGILIVIAFFPSNTEPVATENSTDLEFTVPTENLCGPLSLLEICQFYGIKANVKELAVLSKTQEHGSSLEGLFEASQHKELQPIALHTTIDELTERASPAILHVNENHFFVVQKIEGDNVYILDPPKKPYIISKKRLSEMWKGTALCFERPLPNSRNVSVLDTEELIYDIGTIQSQDTVIQTFHLTNPENTPYTVSNIGHSCSCSTTLLQIGTIIPSKETTLVDMKVNLSGKSNRFEESMKIYINNSEKPRYILTIQGIVKQPLRLSPQIIYTGKITRTDTIGREAILIASKDQTVRITSIETSTPAITVKTINEEQKSNQVTLHITVYCSLLEDVRSNILNEKITIYTDDLETSKLELPVQGMILDDISCVPHSILFGVVAKGQSVSKSVKILVRNPNIKLVNAQSHSQLVSVNLNPSTDQTKYEITATLLETAPSGVLKTTIKFFTEPHIQTLTIPVYALVK